jgi:hypothetical protein
VNVVAKLKDYSQRAAHVFMTDGTREKYASHGSRVLQAAATAPTLPTTRETAIPHVLLSGSFKDEPGLAAVGVYLEIGFIEVRDLKNAVRVHQIVTFDGAHVEERRAYLNAALHLYFNIKSPKGEA